MTNILIPSIPRGLRISRGLVEDMICNPVFAAETFFKVKLDEFQKVRLKISWFTSRVMDSSGVSCGKTFGLWMTANLRCLLFPEVSGAGHTAAIYYPNFDTGQKTFWQYFHRIAARSKLFRAQVGRSRIVGIDGKTDEDGKASLKGQSCWCFTYKNLSEVLMPAGNFIQNARGQASKRFHFLGIDEYAKIMATGSTGIEDQLIGRTTLASWNKEHPLWGNKIMYLSTAEDSMAPSYEKYRSFMNEIEKGNPDYAHISFSFKDFSNLPCETGKSFSESYRENRVMHDLKISKPPAGYREEALGLWSKTGKALYTQDQMTAAYELGKERNVLPMISHHEDREKDAEKRLNVHYFLGADPAEAKTKKADDGALVVLRVQPRVELPQNNVRDWIMDFVWAYKVRKADATQWSAIMHRKEMHFGFDGIMMDPGGGGNWIRMELAKVKQIIRDVEVKCVPIACAEDEAETMVAGKFILCMFKGMDSKLDALWGHMGNRHPDNLTDQAHTDFQESWSNTLFGLPTKFKDRPGTETDEWPDEKKWANRLLDLMATQLPSITVRQHPDGTTYTNGHRAREFSSKGRKDFAYAGLMAYTRFLCWLKTHEDGFGTSKEDEENCG